MIDWQPYAERLVNELVGKGALASDWREAFLHTPRHVFVPAFYDTPDGEMVSGDTPIVDAGWLDRVYRDESLTTQVMTAPGADLPWPTSSSTRPSLMAEMLGLLEVHDGHRLLEVGTGTGYNAAIVCHRLGDGQVTSIDIDASLVATAGTRLADLGHHPHLLSGDGAAGAPGRAPFDRIIATCGVPRIPAAWIGQLTDRGVIVADVRGELASNLVVARAVGRDVVQGRFLPRPGHFMWLRSDVCNPLRDGGEIPTTYDFTDPQTDTSDIPVDVFENPDFRFILQLAVPRLGPIGRTVRHGHTGVFLTGDSDPTWIEITRGTNGTEVRYGGPRLLWPAILDTWRRWSDWGQPAWERFGFTARSDGVFHVWLDRADHIVLTLPES